MRGTFIHITKTTSFFLFGMKASQLKISVPNVANNILRIMKTMGEN